MYGPCFSSIVRGHPLRPLTRRRLGRPLPYQLADGTQVPPEANYSFNHQFLNPMTTCGISNPFGLLSHTSGQVTNALLTRSPLGHIAISSFDLHVLGTPPAFILSQDQTLRKKYHSYECKLRNKKRQGCRTSYHSSVVKVPSTRRTANHPHHVGLSRFPERQIYRCRTFYIGAPDCNTFVLRLWRGRLSKL